MKAVVFALASMLVMTGFGEEKIDFKKDIQPVLESKCVSCHRAKYKTSSGRTKKPKGGIRVDTAEEILKEADNGKIIVPGKPKESLFFKAITLDKDDEDIMPPEKKGGKLDAATIKKIELWIKQGAKWPKGLVLKPKDK